MAQLSPPFRIALVVMLGFVAVWFTVLRPKPVESTPAPAPGVTGLNNTVNAAKDAAKASDAANAAVQEATGEESATATNAGATKARTARAAKAEARAAAVAGVAKSDPSRPLIGALADDKVVVLLFWNEKAADDRAVRRALARTDRHDGAVVTKVADVEDVGEYRAITQKAQVTGSPTALVIGPDRKATPIVGYTTRSELDQVVSDALAARR